MKSEEGYIDVPGGKVWYRAVGDNADATSDGGAKAPDGTEPDLKDAASRARQSDLDSTG